MIIVIRISGQVNIPKKIEETLHRLRLRKKYTAIILKPTKENLKLLNKIRNYVAYGDIDKETLQELIKKRATLKDKSQKIDPEKIIQDLEKKKLSELDIKPFLRLHPPIGGIDSKKHSGIKKGVLGDNKNKINNLVRRML